MFEAIYGIFIVVFILSYFYFKAITTVTIWSSVNRNTTIHNERHHMERLSEEASLITSYIALAIVQIPVILKISIIVGSVLIGSVIYKKILGTIGEDKLVNPNLVGLNLFGKKIVIVRPKWFTTIQLILGITLVLLRFLY